jgi:RimJ/RimL family protein N-acetyltransferase
MIFGEKSCLRRPEREDYALIWHWCNDPELQRLTMHYPFSPNFDELEFHYNKTISDPLTECFVIHSFDNKAIGTIDLYNIDLRNRKSSLSIMIGENEYRDRGYGQDALKTIINFAFKELGLMRIETKVVEYNKKAIRSLENCGFLQEGCLKKRILWDGKFHNQYIMAILNHEL